MKTKIYVVSVLAPLCLASAAFSQDFLKHRNHIKLVNWRFYKGDVHGAEGADNISQQGWQNVTVPHTWNARDVLTDGYHYYRGIGWYRTDFDLPAEKQNKRYFIRFEGASLVTDVFVNGKYVGEHKGGYSAFCFEITPHVYPGRRNRIAVKVDNSLQPDAAPSGTYLYPLFGGIYRPVTIFTTNKICISPLDYASSGVYIKPTSVSKKQADIEVEAVLNYKKTGAVITSSPELLPPDDKEGTGLYGRYFSNPDFRGEPVHTRVDEQVSFDYGTGPAFEDMPVDNFSIIWTGRFVPQRTGLYKFVLESDDGSRLYIDGNRIIDHWGSHAASKKWGQIHLEQGKEVPLKIEYNETASIGSVMFGWIYQSDDEKFPAVVKAAVLDHTGQTVTRAKQKVSIENDQQLRSVLKMSIDEPHLWNAKKDPYLYTLDVRLENLQEVLLDRVKQPLGLRYFRVDRDKGLILNGQPYHLYGVCRHQEWQGLGPALSNEHHEKDIEFILEVGANGVRLAHYQQADKMYSLCDEKGLIVWAEIPNTPIYRAENPAYLQNCKQQLIELIKQNYNHPSIFFWGLYNEVPIPVEDLEMLQQTAKKLDPYRLTTQADFSQPTDRHFVTDVAAWNWYFGWYYDTFDRYSSWYDELHEKFPRIKAGLSEYGAGGCITQQKENPARPDPTNGKFFPEQYQRLYHEEVWKNIKDRRDIWCKFIWNMFDFSWTPVNRGDRPYINHKGLMTHDRKVKKDSFYFYKANWSDEPVLYIFSRRNDLRTQPKVEVGVYTNLGRVELSVNGRVISSKPVDSDIQKITWQDIELQPGVNKISVTAHKDGKKYTDSCEWTYKGT